MQRFDYCKARGCDTMIQWATTPAGKTVAVDAVPITSSQDERAIRHRKAPLYTLAEGRLTSHGNASVAFSSARNQPLFISHFATCEKRDQFRRAK